MAVNKINGVEVVVIKTDRFVAIPDNPRQRDTIKHAIKASKGHLASPSESHRVVAAAAINGNVICKLDGHTRSHLWKTGKLAKPNEVVMMVYSVSNLSEAAELYSHFDNVAAVETSMDRMSGAMRESEFVPCSALFRSGRFATALKIATSLGNGSKYSEYQLLKAWRGTLMEVDSWELPSTKFRGTGLVALMLLLVAAETHVLDNVREFFVRYANDEGTKDGRLMDGVEALDKHMDHRQANRQMTGYENILDIMAKGLSCVNAHCKGQVIAKVQPSTEDLKQLHATAISKLSFN